MKQSQSYKRKRPIENLFKNDVARLIDFFIFNPEFSYSLKELNTLTGIPNQHMRRILMTLQKNKIISGKKTGNEKSFGLNNNSQLSQTLISFVHQSINMEIDKHIKAPTWIINK